MGPTGNFQGSYHFLNFLSGLIIKRHAFVELPAPQSIINHVTALALKFGVARKLIFANQNCILFSWPTQGINRAADADSTLVAPYPDIPAEMPGMLLEHHLSMPMARVSSFSQPDPDWTQLANETAKNANLDLTDALPLPLEVITINNDDVFQVPLVQPPTLLPIRLPKVEQSLDTPAPLPHPWDSSHYPPGARRPPQHLHGYIFTTVAAEHALPPECPYHTTGGSTVDLTIPDECMMAQICHYVMTHTAGSRYYAKGDKPTKKAIWLEGGSLCICRLW